MLRSLPWPLAVSLSFVACATRGPEPAAADEPPPDQIRWQRNLDDALALAKANGMPLFVAVNMDGESASDRIYRERYRDPRFVALTRHCVCVPASVFRHNARDHDDHGNRIPCPRFGEITCGEHMALEPVLFEKFLADGDRVAPRHAWVRPDGSKAFDLSLCFDMHDIDRAMQQAAGDVAPPALHAATSCDHAHRLLAELALVRENDAALAGCLEFAAVSKEPLGVDAFLRLVPRLVVGDATLRDRFAAAVRARGLSAAIGAALCARLQQPGQVPSPAERTALLHVLGQLDDANGGFRLFANAEAALADPTAPTFPNLLAAMQQARGAGASTTGTNAASDVLPEAEALERELVDVEQQLAQRRDDAGLLARYAKASLDLARRRLETGGKDVRLLLEDAETFWQRALAKEPKRFESWIERARTSYFRGEFALEYRCGQQALAIASGRGLGELPGDVAAVDARVADALRWIGDARARQLGDPAGQSPAALGEAIVAFGLVAASAHGDAKDQLSIASLLGVLGCWRAELDVATAGAMRFPAAVDVRGCISQALNSGGAVELEPVVAQTIVAAAPGADSEWFVGQAEIAWAEDCRRRDDMATAVNAYLVGLLAFQRAAAANPAYADACQQRIAACWLGCAMAKVRTPAREQALADLEQAIAAHASVPTQRDGLDYDALDVVDRLLEWREDGPSPVTTLALHERLQRAAPGVAFWPTAIADAAIREALRADGRNPDRVERETVDAGGKPVRTAMGRATDLGDAWLRDALVVARAARATALANGATPPEAAQEAKTTLAQVCVLWAERQLERDRLDGVQPALAEASAVLGAEAPAASADRTLLAAVTAQLRHQLGPARPRFRESR